MRMIRSEAKVPPWDVGASNKHGPPVSRPPNCWLHIRGKPRTREPVCSRVPARNKAPASHLQLVLVIRPPSLLWESSVRPPTESQQANLILTGTNYWETGTAPGMNLPTQPSRHRASGCRTGEVCGKRDGESGRRWECERGQHDGTRLRWGEGVTRRV